MATITPEMAKAELARRSQMSSITPEMAKAELEKRKSVFPDSIYKNIKSGENPLEAFGSFIKKHPYKSILQSLRETITGETTDKWIKRNEPDYSKRLGNVDKLNPIVRELGKASISVDEFGRGMAATAADMVSAPIGTITGIVGKGVQLASKIPVVAQAGQAVGSVVAKPFKSIAKVGGK